MADNPSDAQPPQIPASQPTQMPSHQPSPKNKSSNRTSSNRILLWGAAAVGALAALGIGAYFLSSYCSNDTDTEKSGDAQQISEFVADEDKIVGADESAIGTDESAKIAQQQDKDAEKYTFSNYSIDDKIELSLKTSLEGKRSILSDAVNDSDIMNVFLQLKNAETYEGQTLRVRYWMLSRDNYVFATQGFNAELRGKLISL